MSYQNHPIPVKAQLFLNSLSKSPIGQAITWSGSGEIVGHWRGWKISSVFQPILHSVHSVNAHGYEAFIRCVNSQGVKITPRGLFANTSDAESLMHLDRLCRTVHLLNFILGTSSDKKLFLNVHDGLIFAVVDNHGSAFRKVVDALGFSSKRVVIELPLELSRNTNHLSFVLQNYRLNSLDIAINIDSIEQWLSIPQLPKVSYIKIARNILDTYPNPVEQVKALLASDPDVKVVITKNETFFDSFEDSRLYTQGHSYGYPAQLVSDFPLNIFGQQDVTTPGLFIGG
ncbi:EAL domain-containing protein [Polynucleobacter victoriensis]|uniref:EAL domain-containing protein n=1 Tax=Polynucleobacter victoriensis TaxID=2049319 RepID=A0A212T3L2_9BURK|nr:EAL domain-containing protein [Polynucleobacter victoriensis]SNC60628.1 EAL domain-containing protein [Polynucleobacter victoriensis]